MDSINSNQVEQNRADLQGTKAIDQAKEIIDKAKSCFFCTITPDGNTDGVRPMTIQKMDEGGTIWFLSANDSHKNEELATDETVRLYFQGSPHSSFLYLDGTTRISQDRTLIHELWEPVMKTWFTEGENDPRISVIRFEPKSGYYWDNKHGGLIAGAKMLIGAATGKTLDDSIEGVLTM